MNESEIREYILNIIKEKTEDIESHGGITLCFNNRLNDNLFFGQIIKEEQALINTIKCLREELKDEYIIDLESSYTSMFKLAVYHVIIKKINRVKTDSLNNTKEGLSMENLNELKDALLIIKNYCKGKDCKRCGLSSNEECILTLNTPQDWNILDEPIIKIMTDE